MKIGTNYQPFIPQTVGPPTKAAAKPAAGNGETSPFQQLLAIMGTNAKNEEGNVLVSRERFSEPPKQQEEAAGQMAIEEWLPFLLFIWNNMEDANQTDDASMFANRPIGQAVANNEMIARFIQQIDKNMLINQISDAMNEESSPRLLSLLNSDAFVEFIEQMDKGVPMKLSNGINDESSRLFPFLDADMTLSQNGTARNIDIQTLFREILARWNNQAEKSAEISSNSDLAEKRLWPNRFFPSSSSVFSQSFNSPSGNAAATEKNSSMTLFTVPLPDGNIVAPQANAPMIVVDETLSGPKANESFLQQLTNIIQSGRLTRFQNGNAQLVIRLYPEHLGTLTVKIAREHGTLTAKLIASTDSAKELLDANLSQLYHVLSTENITVEKWNALAQDRYMPAFYQEERGHEQKERQQRKEERPKKQSFHAAFMTEMIDTEA